MANISFKIACRELKIAQIAHWVNQLFQLLNLVRLYGYRMIAGFTQKTPYKLF